MEIGTNYTFNDLRSQNLANNKRTYKVNSESPKRSPSVEEKDILSIAEETAKAINVKIEDVSEAVNLIREIEEELLKHPEVRVRLHQNLVSERVMELIG